MSVTIAHRPHIQVSWPPILVVLAIAAAAVLTVVLVVQLSTTTPAQTSAQPAHASAAAASGSGAVMAKNRSPVVRAIMSGEAPATRPAQSPALSLKRAGAPWAATGAK